MSTFTRNNKIILNTASSAVYLGAVQEKNIFKVNGTTIIKGNSQYAGNRGLSMPNGEIVTFQAYTAGTAPTDRLAIYRGNNTSTRLATMVRASGGGKIAGALYKGDSVDDLDYLGLESGASDGGGAAAAAFILLIQPPYGNPPGLATKYSSEFIKP